MDLSPGARRLALTAVALATTCTLLTACGSSGKTATAASSTPGTTAPAATSSAASSAASSSAGGSVNVGSLSGSFCDLAKQEQAQENEEVNQFTSDTPAQLEKFEQQALTLVPVWVSKAPPSIKSDVATVGNAAEAVYAELKKINFDFTKIPASFANEFETPAFTNATKAIDSYLTTVCKIPLSTPSS